MSDARGPDSWDLHQSGLMAAAWLLTQLGGEEKLGMRSGMRTPLHSVDGKAVASRRCKHCHCLQHARLACRVMKVVIQSAYTGACASCMYILHSARQCMLHMTQLKHRNRLTLQMTK